MNGSYSTVWAGNPLCNYCKGTGEVSIAKGTILRVICGHLSKKKLTFCNGIHGIGFTCRYGLILKLFEDDPAAMFSIHKIAQGGLLCHRSVGQVLALSHLIPSRHQTAPPPKISHVHFDPPLEMYLCTGLRG